MLSKAERNRLVEEHGSYVRALAAQIKERLPPEIEYDELCAYGTQGLLEAAERWDPRGGASFTTFSYYRIRGAIYDGLRRMGLTSRSQRARLRAAERAGEYLSSTAELPQDVAGAAALTAIADRLAAVATVYVSTLAGEADEAPAEGPDAEGWLCSAEMAGVVHGALAALPEKERRLIELHYFEGKNLQESGRVLGLSKSWTSRLHARAIDLLRTALDQDT
jgi:RNA polymerase sigma factor for flagellar operon FliA